MRKRYRVLILAAIVAAFIVPVGFALSIESTSVPGSAVAHLPAAAVASSAMAASVAIAAPSNHLVTRSTGTGESFRVPDSVKLLVIGTSLFGVAAAFRKRSKV
jgi:hypothetical protein